MSVAVGTRLADRYVLLDRIGGGGMGAVWRAVDEVLDRQVAIKVLAAQLSDDAEFRQRFRREARAAARLDHPHITHVYDYGEVAESDQAVQYLVMELLSGHTLAERLREGPVPRQDAVTIGAEVAEALTAAHRHGVVHRDITPGNIMLTPTGAKVLDFGISTIAGDAAMTAAGRTLGTPAYLAPERIAGQPATPAVDVYALAAVLVHAITGRTPYEGSWSQQAHAHVHDPPPDLTDMPDDLARLLHACLAKDPASRPPSDALARSLRAQAASMPPDVGAATHVLPTQQGTASSTRVLPAYATYQEVADRRRGGPGRMLAWLALIVAVVAAILVAANILNDRSPTAQSTPPVETPAVTTPPATTPPAEPEQTSLAGVIEEISAIGAAAVTDGEMTRRVARDIDRSLTTAIDQAGREDYRDAERTLEQLADRLEERAEDDDLDEDVREEIDDRLDILIDALDEAGD